MRNKTLEKRRNDFMVNYYHHRMLVNPTLTKELIGRELNTFYTFSCKSNVYKILKNCTTKQPVNQTFSVDSKDINGIPEA